MAELRIPLNIRIAATPLKKLLRFADREKRKPSDLAALLIEWSIEQLTAVGSSPKLLGLKARTPRERVRR
jgi:hypothetical protein